ncbi:unnamed protein product [Parnassius mnemosyne]|uniref:FP protein C-terminal domain-containing protein n=1 Tax=Parnassius mnemosyne TaxID=213953 RepID=A0AAV1M4K0_9NEOP
MMSPPTETCAACAKPLRKREYLRCCNCKEVYDIECLNISSKRFYSFYSFNKERKDNWKCISCVSKLPRTNNLNTPVRTADSEISSPPALVVSPEKSYVAVRHKNTQDKNIHVEQSSAMENIMSESLDGTAMDFKLLLSEMKAIRAEMRLFHNSIADLMTSIKMQSNRIDSIETRISALEDKSKGLQRCEVSTLEETVSQLKSQILERDQDLLSNDIQIAGFPETSGENTAHIILAIAKKLCVDLDERDVVSSERTGFIRDNGESPTALRPRLLVVRLARRAQRDALIQAARVRRNITTEGLGLMGIARRIYVNERLTKHNSRLFYKARVAAKSHGWKYVWSRDGKIYVRKEHGSERHRLRLEEDLAKVFGVVAVGSKTMSLGE